MAASAEGPLSCFADAFDPFDFGEKMAQSRSGDWLVINH